MNYQLMLPEFSRYFRSRVTTYLERIGRWGIALYLIERGDNLYLYWA